MEYLRKILKDSKADLIIYDALMMATANTSTGEVNHEKINNLLKQAFNFIYSQ